MPRKEQRMYQVTLRGGIWTQENGKDVYIPRGQLVSEAHPLVKAMPDAFKLAVPRPSVEQATVAPGEQRGD